MILNISKTMTKNPMVVKKTVSRPTGNDTVFCVYGMLTCTSGV